MRSARRLLRVGCLLLALAPAARGQDRPAVVIDPGQSRTYGVAVQRFADGSATPSAGRVGAFREQIERGLEYSSVFRVIPAKAFLGPETTVSLDGGPGVVCPDWSSIGGDALVEGAIEVSATRFEVEFRVWDTTRCSRLLRKTYQQSAQADLATLARRIADDIVAAFVGVRGVSATEIAFVSTRRGGSEIHVMNADGSNARAATANRSINTFPSWSPSGESILYTSYRYANRPLLFVSTRGRGKPGRVLSRIGDRMPQYRGVFAPLGPKLAVVMSEGDASEIYTVDSDGRNLRRLTNNRVIDVSPSWSPDASQIAFVSDRSGSPQVYVMQADGSDQRRLTFQGSYNTNPAWSPDGRWIAYETRLEGQFDIWLIDPRGGATVPLISHPRNDESPSWAPNGRKLAFSSTRRGRADIYVADLTGDEVLRLTENAGNNTSPSWGPFPR
jgi:TolB protein